MSHLLHLFILVDPSPSSTSLRFPPFLLLCFPVVSAAAAAAVTAAASAARVCCHFLADVVVAGQSFWTYCV